MRLKTKIEGNRLMGKGHIKLEVNSTQLWYIMLGLERIELSKRLEKGTTELSEELREIGVKKFDWIR